jgi:hypothetical protein
MDKNYGYKHTKGFILFVLISIILLMSTCYGQTADNYTGNTLNTTSSATTSTSTWQGVGLLNGGLPCWAPGDPGYCGPNAYANTNSLNFSYGLSDAHQYVNVAKSLPYSGSGLITTGFRFSWMSKNGNGWEPTTNLDVLSSYVQLYDRGNKLVENFYWDLNYIHNWTTFTYDKNWSKEYRPSDVSNAKFGFKGMDTSYWAGPYGPEVTNISFQLKYKPDPCLKNQLYSPECPLFTETLEKATATPVIKETNITQTTPTQNYNTTMTTSSIDNRPTKEENHTLLKTDKLESALFKIFDGQVKQEQISLDIATNAVKETNKVATQTLRQAERIAKQSVERSFELSNINDNKSLHGKTNDLLTLLLPPTQNTIGFQLPGVNSSIFSLPHDNIANNNKIDLLENVSVQRTTEKNYLLGNYNQNNSIEISNFVVPQFLNSTIVNVSLNNQVGALSILQGPTETNSSTNNFLTNRTNPINDILERKVGIDNNSNETKTAIVKRNVQDNELANGVDINRMAVAPQGYNAYLQLALKDAAFYSPKEIYRNQKTIDNNRALRQLASDRLHQEMVDQQYRR